MSNTFEVTSGKIIVTDPCYEFDGVKVIPAKNGNWRINVEHNRNYDIAELFILHEDFYKSHSLEHKAGFTCPVDSGQAGVFDAEQYAQHQGGEFGELDTFYGKCCAITTGDDEDGIEEGWGIVKMNNSPIGAVCVSGCGDGDYEVTVFKPLGSEEAYGVRIYFNNYSDEELFDDDEENWDD